MSVPHEVPPHPRPDPDDPRLELRADCSSCVGLCCVVPAFSASTDFAIDKPARTPCPNLAADFGCSIHAELPDRGFPGCAVYDCFGAGQRVAQGHLGAGDRGVGDRARDWRSSPEEAAALFAAFEVVERLHELLWYLLDALDRPATKPVRHELEGLRDAVLHGVEHPGEVAVATLQLRADPLLGEASALVRAGAGGARLRGRDLAGRDLRQQDLASADLRGAVLLGADLRGLDLADADLLGADLRGADVRGARLAGTLFLTRFQAAAARGDAITTLPAVIERPGTWSTAQE